MIRILQINIDRTRRVASEVREEVVRNEIDIVALQEPYIYEGKIAGFGMDTIKIHGGEGGVEDIGAALILFNRSIGIMKLEGLSDRNCVVVEVLGRGSDKILSSIHVLQAIRKD